MMAFFSTKHFIALLCTTVVFSACGKKYCIVYTSANNSFNALKKEPVKTDSEKRYDLNTILLLNAFNNAQNTYSAVVANTPDSFAIKLDGFPFSIPTDDPTDTSKKNNTTNTAEIKPISKEITEKANKDRKELLDTLLYNQDTLARVLHKRQYLLAIALDSNATIQYNLDTLKAYAAYEEAYLHLLRQLKRKCWKCKDGADKKDIKETIRSFPR